ncbi:MAG: sulfatase-like hydrolase/transferase [Alphaproteobacteria bacterium]|nr:sulfatase-like hydrolase/transferase [Alphaproteobacteria bacterium]
MERNNLALLGVLALALVAAGIAFYVADDGGPKPTVGAPAAAPLSRAKIKGSPLQSRLARKGVQIKPMRVAAIALGEPDDAGASTLKHLEKAPEGPPPKGSRILFVTWDTVRADHVSAYGYFRQTTPTFDALAGDGLLFEHFIVPQSTTLPSHVSMFTGVHPDEHGVTGNSASGSRRFVPPANLTPLARHLSDAGYRTAAFVSSSPVKQYSGIANGFQDWSEPKGRWRRAIDTTLGAKAWIAEAPEDRPFLLWVHVYDPHSPYTMPIGYEKTFGGPEELDGWLAERGIDNTPLGKKGNRSAANAVNNYDAEIRYIDDQLKVLLEALAARGFDDTIVVVAGDHGEGLRQHGHLEHGLVWEEQLAAPLVIKAPGTAPQRIATLTTAQDVLPVLAAVGDLPGEDALLAPASGRNVLADRNDRPILSRLSRRQLRDLKVGGNEPMQWSLRTSTHQLIFRETGDHDLYDLRTDPHALHDIADANPALVAELSAQIEALNALHAKRATELGAGETEPLDPAIVEELEALGYVDE